LLFDIGRFGNNNPTDEDVDVALIEAAPGSARRCSMSDVTEGMMLIMRRPSNKANIATDMF